CGLSSRGRHTRFSRGWSSDVCSSDLGAGGIIWGKLGAVLAGLVVQVALLLTTAAILGLDASVVNITGTAFALLSGAAALVSWGVLMAGTLRPEATLAVANLLWVLIACVGGLLLPRS